MTGNTIISAEQHRIIKAPPNVPLTVVTAAAGSGKTQTLVLRASALVAEHRIPPQSLLFLTFTRSARAELESRLKVRKLQQVRISTLHSLAMRTLRQLGQSVALIANDQLEMMAHEVGRLCLSERYGYDPDRVAEQVMRRISQLTQTGAQPRNQEDQLIWKKFGELFDEFQIRQSTDIVTYDQLLQSFLSHLQQGSFAFQRITHIFVDESQDLSPLQYNIIRRLSRERYLTLVGDPRQAIFGFQGATPELLQAATLEANQTYSLSTNYRCPASHVRLAQRLFPEADPVRAEQPYRRVSVEFCDGDIAKPLIAAVRRALADLLEVDERARLAVLVRSRREVTEVARLLMKDGVAVQLSGRTREVLDPFTRQWLRPCVDCLTQERRQARHPLLDLQGGLPVTGSERAVLNAAWLARRSPTEARDHVCSDAGKLLLAVWEHLGAEPITNSMQLAAALRELARDHDVELGMNQAEHQCRIYPELTDLRLALLEQPPMSEQLPNTVLVSTIHGAKGREWDGVVLTELQSAVASARDPEEFRLRYVALTRSRHLLSAVLPSACHAAYRQALDANAVGAVNRIATLLQLPTSLWTQADQELLDQQQEHDPQLVNSIQKIKTQQPGDQMQPTLSRVPIRWQA